MSTKPVVFFHVMKCGGTSVRSGLATSVAGHRDGAGVFELDGQAAQRAVGGHDPDNWTFRDWLLPYVLLTADPSIVLGHFRYRDEHEPFLDAAHFVTVLRDPVERFVSLYRYRRWKKDVDVPVEIPFDEFVDTGRWQKEGHNFVSLFCGHDGMDPRSDEAIDAAVANLRRFAVVGLLDRIDLFSKEVGSHVGRDVSIPLLNTSPAPERGSAADVDQGALERAREICEPDIRVFERIRSEGA